MNVHCRCLFYELNHIDYRSLRCLNFTRDLHWPIFQFQHMIITNCFQTSRFILASSNLLLFSLIVSLQRILVNNEHRKHCERITWLTTIWDNKISFQRWLMISLISKHAKKNKHFWIKGLIRLLSGKLKVWTE